MTALDLLLGILATWRIAALLCYDERFEWLRQLAKTDLVDNTTGRPITYAGRILSCFWCTSLSVGVQVTLFIVLGWQWVLLPFALSGGGIILHHWTRINRDVMQDH